jgi:hypothetical protein
MFAIGASEIGVSIVFLIFLVLGLAASAFWVWMLVDCVQNETDGGNNKIIWILIIVLAGVVGALVYFFVRRSQRLAQMGRV